MKVDLTLTFAKDEECFCCNEKFEQQEVVEKSFESIQDALKFLEFSKELLNFKKESLNKINIEVNEE